MLCAPCSSTCFGKDSGDNCSLHLGYLEAAWEDEYLRTFRQHDALLKGQSKGTQPTLRVLTVYTVSLVEIRNLPFFLIVLSSLIWQLIDFNKKCLLTPSWMCQHWTRCCGNLIFISMYLTQAMCLKKHERNSRARCQSNGVSDIPFKSFLHYLEIDLIQKKRVLLNDFGNLGKRCWA